MGIIQLIPASLCSFIGRFLGFCAWLLLPRYRKLVRRNLTIAFGKERSPSQIASLARQHFQTLGANLLGAAHFFTASEKEVREHTTIENLDILEAAHARGHGVVLAISHIGNWELFAQASFYAPAMPFGTVFQKVHNQFIDAAITRFRRRLGVRTFDRKSELNAAAAFLRTGGVLGVLVDQHAGTSGIWTPLFGRLASTSPLGATLALKTGAAVVPVAIFTAGLGRWRICIRPEVTHPEDCSPEALTASINRALENQIRESPADWFWVHNRWKLPSPEFLLARAKRGLYLPDGADSLQKLRIVIRGSNWLGDAVMNVPAVRAIKAGRPDLHLAVLTPAKLADMWRSVSAVDEVIAIPEGASVFRVAALLRGQFEVGIIFPNSLRTALEMYLANIPRRVGFPGHFRRRFLNQFPRNRKGHQPSIRPEHHANHYSLLADRIGAPPPPDPPAIMHSAETKILLGVCPGAEYGPAKRWPIEKFRSVMETISAQYDCQWHIFGVKKDSPLAHQLAHGFSGKVIDRTGKTTLSELMAELRQMRLLLTNDTGTMHLAALLGVPVVALFGSTEPALTSPFGSANIILREQVECSPCFRRKCPLDFRCMNALTPEMGSQAVLQILHRQNADKPSAIDSLAIA